MSDEHTDDTPEREAEKRETEEKQTEQHGPADRQGKDDPAEDAAGGAVPGQAGGRSD